MDHLFFTAEIDSLPTLTQEDTIRANIPHEVIIEILSYLDMPNLQTASLISHYWNEASITSAKNLEFSQIRALTHKITSHLDEESNGGQIKALRNLKEEATTFTIAPLLQTIKLYRKEMKEKILAIVKALPKEPLIAAEKSLAITPAYKYWKKTLTIALVYKELDGSDGALSIAAQKMVRLGELSRAPPLANSIGNKFLRNYIYLGFARNFYEKKQLKKGLQFAGSIKDRKIRDFFFIELATSVGSSAKTRAEMEEAREIAKKIEAPHLKDLAFEILGNISAKAIKN